MRAVSLLLAGVVVLVACGGDSRAKTGIAVHDSSGVAIVDHDSTALRKAAQFTLGTPIFTMGGASADSMHNSSRIYAAVLVGGGKFVTLDGRASRLVLFDSTGAVLASWGKHGDGPGAVNAPGGLRLLPDGTIQLVDFPARVLHLSAANLTVTGESKVGPSDPIFAVLLHQTAPGSAIAVESEADQGSGRNQQYLVRVRRDGVDTLTTWRGDDQARYGRRALARAWGNQIVVAGMGWVFTVRDSLGAVKREVVVHQAARPVTAEMRDSSLARDRRQVDAASLQDKEAIAEMMKSIRFADSVAAFEDIVEGRDGTLWMGEYAITGDADRFYAVFDSAGKLAKRVKVPSKQKLLAADGDLLLLRWVDEKNAGHIDMVRLVAATAYQKK